MSGQTLRLMKLQNSKLMRFAGFVVALACLAQHKGCSPKEIIQSVLSINREKQMAVHPLAHAPDSNSLRVFSFRKLKEEPISEQSSALPQNSSWNAKYADTFAASNNVDFELYSPPVQH